MGEWEEWSSADEGDDFQLQPLARKKRTAAKSSEPAKRKRFAEPATSAEFEKLSAGVIPKNTQKNEQWALRVSMSGFRSEISGVKTSVPKAS